MDDTSFIDPSKRQVLVNLGTRFVVFGPDGGLPEPLRFDPQETIILPRIIDEGEVSKAYIAETVQVSGMTRDTVTPNRTDDADIEFVDSNGNRILVDIKIRESDPRRKELESGNERLRRAKSKNVNLEIWFFNTERLKLTMMRDSGPAFNLIT